MKLRCTNWGRWLSPATRWCGNVRANFRSHSWNLGTESTTPPQRNIFFRRSRFGFRSPCSYGEAPLQHSGSSFPWNLLLHFSFYSRTSFLGERIGRDGLRRGSPERLSSDRIGGVPGHQRSCCDDCLFRGDPMDDLLNRAQVLRATSISTRIIT